MYYDKQGKEITLKEWALLLEDKKHKRVASDTTGKYWVSTVWLGLDHSFEGGIPLIFETMVFEKDKDGTVNYRDLEMERYHTLKEANEGHKKMVKKWSGR